MQNPSAIKVINLNKSFKKLKVLSNLSFEIKKGTIFALLGPNGAGKTTIVRILSTLLRPDDGKVLINGFDVEEQADEVRKIIGLTGQYAAIDEYLTGRENLEMMGRLYHLPKDISQARAQALLEQFDLIKASGRAAKTYSGGMRRRLDLAASLVATPPIIFLDEPTTGLDPRSRISMWKIIEELKNQGTTILLTTQYLEEADKLADRVLVIDKGQVIAEGTVNELKSRVGKNRLELGFKNQADLIKTNKIFQQKNTTINETEISIHIEIDNGAKEVKDILNHLESINVEVESLSLHKPTLDDVFLKLTGHQTEVLINNDIDKND